MLLEIGCGNAIHLAELASAFSHLIGADISPGMVDAAWRKVQTFRIATGSISMSIRRRNLARSTTRPWALCFVSRSATGLAGSCISRVPFVNCAGAGTEMPISRFVSKSSRPIYSLRNPI